MASPADSLAGILQIPGVQELLNSQITQSRQQVPLRVGATQTALGMLPNSSFGGSSARPDVSAIAPANYTTAAPKEGGSALASALKYLAAAGAGAEAARGGSDITKAIDWLKSLFGGGRGVQGNKPYTGGALTGGGQPAQYPFGGFAGNEGMDPNLWDPQPTPGVSTSESYQFPGLNPEDPFNGGGGVLPGLPGEGSLNRDGTGNDWWNP